MTWTGPPGPMAAASALVRMGVDPGEGFDFGAGVRVLGQAMATDPGERAAIVVFVTTATGERRAPGVFAVAAGLRREFVERSVTLPDPGAALLPGLAVRVRAPCRTS